MSGIQWHDMEGSGSRSGSSPKPISYNSPKDLPPASLKPVSHSSSPKPISVSSSPKPLALCSPRKPLPPSTSIKDKILSLLKLLPLSSSPKPPTSLAPQKPSHEQRGLRPSSEPTQPVDNPKESSGNQRKRGRVEDSLKQPVSLQLSSQHGNDIKRRCMQSSTRNVVFQQSAQSLPSRKEQSRTAGQKKRARAEPDSLGSCIKKAKLSNVERRWLEKCRVLLTELEAHEDARPFLTPVNLRAAPGYRMLITEPMDFSTIGKNLTNNQYQNIMPFFMDVHLVFENCKKYNEDNSKIGRAGRTMKKFFDKRWDELLMES